MIRPTKFEITDERDGARLTLAIAGELDIGTVGVLKERVDQCLGAGLSEVTLDLGRLAFIDSTGLRSVIELNQRSEGSGWRLRIRPPESDAAMIVFRITGMDKALPFDGQGPE